ncbi:MAG TPA: ATP-binding protein [Opitutaceae bacterium]|nr:ATP-binding protein [Opitutaceae bacterium]
MYSDGSKQPTDEHPGRWRLAACASLVAVLAAWPVAAVAEPTAPTDEIVTDPVQIWPMSTEMKSVAHRIRFEGRVSYYDVRWHNSWLETNGVGTYVKLSPAPPDLRAGQYVRIEGTMIPLKGLAADEVKVTVLKDYVPVEPLATKGRILDFNAWGAKIVTLDAYVDGQQLMDDDHLRLALVAEDRPIIGWIKPDDARSIPDWQGKFVRLVGLYSGRFDSTGTDSSIEIWVSRQKDVSVLGALATDASFDRPRIHIGEIPQVPLGESVQVRGRLQAHQPGASIVIRDETGQVEAQSVQQQRFPFDTEVDVVGRVALAGSQWILRSALYRKIGAPAPASQPPAESAAVIKTVEQIRQLSSEEAARGHPVAIAGTVTWSRPGRDFFFLQDVSGGIRVRYPPAKMNAPPLVAYILVEGVTYNGGFSPAVDLKTFKELGAMSPQAARPVSFDQAITGREDGQWIEMRGFYRRTVSQGERRLIYVTTPTGEFVAELESPVDFEATPGSLINVRGVCDTVTDETGRIAGLTLRVPFLHGISVEESAPADFYNLPLRSIKTLTQLSATRDALRVRVAGTVVHAMPGQLIYLQEDDSGLLVLSSDQTPLTPGDTIEAVGILGREGARPLLREGVYRRRGSGSPPVPLRLADPSHLSTALDARLVRVRGTLLDALRRPERIRLTLQAGNTLFEAVLEPASGAAVPPDLLVGAALELTGVYKSVVDDSRHLRGFQLLLRSPLDIAVVQKARFWTVERALLAVGILAGCIVLGLAWITALRRRVNRQTEQIRRQLEHQARLEAEVQRAARLESLGVLAGGIAHDFNNLLTIIMGNLGLAMLDERTKRTAGEFLREIERGALRARDLTQQLLTFAKGGDPLRTTVSLPEIVQQAAEFVLHGTSARCEYTTVPGLWNANVDKDQITQVVQNIVLNSVQAMPHGGVIRISLVNEEIAARAKGDLAAGRYIRLAIADPGEGISPDILPRIFDPYFTTRKSGSGLGLATVYSIVKKHKGRLEVDSTPGRGTTFMLWLPAAGTRPPQPSAPPAPPPAASVSPVKPGRVLLMDDEESIRRLGAALLQRIGLEPTAVADGAEAVRVFSEARNAHQPFDLLILDLTIPGGMGGKETMDLIRKMDPGVPAIVSSGYSSDPVLADFRSYGFQAMVAKPYEISQLTGAIKQLLAPRA